MLNHERLIPGLRIHSEKHGDGSILAIKDYSAFEAKRDHGRLVIRFDDGEERSFDLTVAVATGSLTLLDGSLQPITRRRGLKRKAPPKLKEFPTECYS